MPKSGVTPNSTTEPSEKNSLIPTYIFLVSVGDAQQSCPRRSLSEVTWCRSLSQEHAHVAAGVMIDGNGVTSNPAIDPNGSMINPDGLTCGGQVDPNGGSCQNAHSILASGVSIDGNGAS